MFDLLNFYSTKPFDDRFIRHFSHDKSETFSFSKNIGIEKNSGSSTTKDDFLINFINFYQVGKYRGYRTIQFFSWVSTLVSSPLLWMSGFLLRLRSFFLCSICAAWNGDIKKVLHRKFYLVAGLSFMQQRYHNNVNKLNDDVSVGRCRH